jgi:hypothetical protein
MVHYSNREEGAQGQGRGTGASGYPRRLFIFFSNNLGCLGSLLVSAVVTLLLLLVLGVIELG